MGQDCYQFGLIWFYGRKRLGVGLHGSVAKSYTNLGREPVPQLVPSAVAAAHREAV
jgi:hypothetical protein